LLTLIAALAAASPATARIDNNADDPVVVIAGDVTIPPETEVDDVYVINGHVRISGRVTGDVVIVDGDLVLRGRIGGNLVMVAGRAHLLRHSSLGGDLTYGDEPPKISPLAHVGGDVQKKTWSDVLGLYSIIGAFVLWLAIGISTVILGLLLLALGP